jgi:hypothetical protein
MHFSLVYGPQAMLPIEVEHKSLRVQKYVEEHSNNSSVDDSIKLEELLKCTVIQSAKHQQAMRHYDACHISS